jgi:hypothetical protein
MNRLLAALLTLLLIPSLLTAFSDEANKKTMFHELDFIKSVFEATYAPAEWKKSYYGWDLEAEVETAKANIASITPITLRDYQQELVRVLNSTRDYHVSIVYHSTEYAFLGFGITSAEGRYFISNVLEFEIEETEEPIPLPAYFQNFQTLASGDEIVYFDGKPIQEAIDDFKSTSFGAATAETDQILAEHSLTARLGSLGNKVPQGPIMIGIRPKGSDTVKNLELEWFYFPEEIESFQETDYRPAKTSSSKSERLLALATSSKMVFPAFEKMLQASKDRMDDSGALGSKSSSFPPLGPLLWENEKSDFNPYIYDLDGHRIGYIRIPWYLEMDEAAKDFLEQINLLEAETDALVIDQLNNPGGIVFYTYALLSMLTDRPLQLPKHQFTLTQEEVRESIEFLEDLENAEGEFDVDSLLDGILEEIDTICGYPITRELLLSMHSFHKFLVSEWKAKRYLTDLYHYEGIDQITPNPKGHYSKPILFLINSLDFSGGDFVPAILQDNQRATIFGTRTAGAGGIVSGFSYPNRFGIAGINLTTSIARRLNDAPIENLGVEPDVHYQVTVDDLQNGYRGYKAKVNETLEMMLHPKN